MSADGFGCARCLPDDAAAAWEAVTSALRIELELVSESHFTIKLRSCAACGQTFVSVFSETVDWQDGEDPQAWCVLAITAEEALQLRAAGSDAERAVASVGAGRRSLLREVPKGSPPRTRWSQGVVIAPHD